MQTSDEVARRIADLCLAWNRAEKAIKLAEQINGEIVNPAIYELRYGGRRLIEVLEKLERGDEQEALGLLRDAHFDCTRSRHDAMDAGTSKVAEDLAIAVKKLGADAVLEAFPRISSLMGQLNAVRQLIAISREDRNNREKIYATVEEDHFGEIAEAFGEFQASEPMLVAYVKRRRRDKLIEIGLAITAIVASFVAGLSFQS